jgi:outer membrane protein TolC
VVEIDTRRINTLRYFERLLLTMLVSWRYTIPILLVCSVASGSAQAGDSDPYFPKPTYFKSYLRRADTRVELQPPLHFEDYVVDGKLELSLKAYLDLVMANNPNVSIQRLSVISFEDSVMRAFGNFDPLGTASFQSTRSLTQGTTALSGASTLDLLTQPFSLGWQQLLSSGATYNIGYFDTKSSTNSSFATINPTYNSSLNVSFSQPLLRGRGSFITKLPITIARARLTSARSTVEDQVIQILVTAEQSYWAVVGAREGVRVAEENYKLADTALKRANRELELGASSPLDIFQPQANFANAQLARTQARYNLQQMEDALRMQMGADLDVKYRSMPIVATEPVTPPPDADLDRERMVALAMDKRQDLRAARQSLDVDDLNIRQANDNLRPNLALNGQYSTSGVGGPTYVLQNAFGAGSQVVSVTPGGITDALGQMFGFGQPTYGFGLSLTLPIRNRAAAANLTDATVGKKIDALRLRAITQTVRLQVLNAITNLENSRASVELAKSARDLAQKRVDAEQKKYELGIDQIFFVLAAQTDLTAAESQLVNQTISYRLNQLALLRALGTLLEERRVTVQ